MADSQRKSYNLFDVSELTAEYPLYVQYSNDTITIPYAYSGLYNTGITIPVEAPYTISCIPVVRDNAATNGRIRLVFADDSVEEIYITDETATITAPIENTYQKSLKAIRFNWSNINNGFSFKNFMINSGSTAKPYEPYGWVHSLRKQCSATETIQSGDTIYANGTAISTYTIKGNTTQSGTPTPTNPVEVSGVGVITANLFDVSTVGAIPYTDANGTPSANKGTLSDGVFSCTYGYYGSRFYINQLIAVTTGTYTFSADIKSDAPDGALRIIKDDGTVIFTENYTDISNVYSRKSKTFTVDTDCSIRVSLQGKGNAQTYQSLDFMFKNVMLAQGTATEYEPYGEYKIPILTNQTTTNIYIGDNPLRKSLDGTAYDTLDSNGTLTQRVDSDGSVLATPIVSQITVPSIPTADGANTITVDTTVQPSEFTATWTGWHDAYVKEYDGTNWQ